MPIPKPILSGHHRSFMIEHLYYRPQPPENGGPTGERLLLNLALPPWQRGEVWTQQQKIAFIEGVFLGLGTGFYVTNGMEWLSDGSRAPMAGWLLDGQQRISAIRDFVAGSLTVFGDVNYKTMAQRDIIGFKNTVFPSIELDYTNDEAKLRELYDRLNFSGTPHSPDQRAVRDEAEPTDETPGPG